MIVVKKITALPASAGNRSTDPSSTNSRVALPEVMQLSIRAVGDAMKGLRPRYTMVKENMIVRPELRKLPINPAQKRQNRVNIVLPQSNLICLLLFSMYLLLLANRNVLINVKSTITLR
jgi:hypothetical protein